MIVAIVSTGVYKNLFLISEQSYIPKSRTYVMGSYMNNKAIISLI